MEPHPVPQNIIDVEFKLFGAFSLRQFGQILIGCMVGVVVYFIPFIPFIVKVPVIILAVLFGLLSALIPYFGTWLLGFAKALIVAPRYVWVKEPARSDILEQSATQQTTKVVNKDERPKIDSLDSLAISDVASEKEDVFQDFLTTGQTEAEKDTFKKLYNKVYAQDLVAKPKIAPTIEQPAKPQVISKPNKQKPSSPNSKVLTETDILKQIEHLRDELRSVSKSEDKEKESEIMGKIGELYSYYKVLKSEPVKPQVAPTRETKQFLKPQKDGKIIFGIVVSRSDKGISNAQVSLINSQTKEVFKGVSSKDGKFATSAKLPLGSYDVVISHPEFKFHTYKVEINDSRLPAFKFREK